MWIDRAEPPSDRSRRQRIRNLADELGYLRYDCAPAVKRDMILPMLRFPRPNPPSETSVPNWMRQTLLSVSVYAALLTPLLAAGQTPTQDEESAGLALGVYDYFTADHDPLVKAYLAAANKRHASEAVWRLYRAGIYTEPLGDCKYVLERFPNHPRALHLMTEIAKAIDQPSIPIEYFESALKRFPQYGFTRAQYGRYLVEIGAVSAGIRELEEALRLDPNQIQARAWLAEARPGTRNERSATSDTANADPAGYGADRK